MHIDFFKESRKWYSGHAINGFEFAVSEEWIIDDPGWRWRMTIMKRTMSISICFEDMEMMNDVSYELISGEWPLFPCPLCQRQSLKNDTLRGSGEAYNSWETFELLESDQHVMYTVPLLLWSLARLSCVDHKGGMKNFRAILASDWPRKSENQKIPEIILSPTIPVHVTNEWHWGIMNLLFNVLYVIVVIQSLYDLVQAFFLVFHELYSVLIGSIR